MDERSYIIRTSGGDFEMWHRKRKRWVSYFDSANPPYANVGTGAREMHRLQDEGVIPTNFGIATVALCALARAYPNRFQGET